MGLRQDGLQVQPLWSGFVPFGPGISMPQNSRANMARTWREPYAELAR